MENYTSKTRKQQVIVSIGEYHIVRLDKDWAIRGHKFAYPGRKDTIKACIYVKELVRFMLWKVEEGVNTDLTDLCPIRTGTAGGSEFIVNS